MTLGIRISDKEERVLSPTLGDILLPLTNGNSLHWSILFIDGTVNPGNGNFFSEITQQVNNSENGIRVTWEELLSISDKFFQIWETVILGSQNTELLHRYKDENEMYNTCDVVLDLIDCSFWEVYSKDHLFLEKLRKKFKDVEEISMKGELLVK